MIEEFENLWQIESDARCITTNGFVKKNGEAVMGAGVAKQAKMLIPQLPEVLGQVIQTVGNHVTPLVPIPDDPNDAWLFSFPVKHNWWEPADLDLIERSALELVDRIEEINQLRIGSLYDIIDRIALPRPGCGNGQLEWSQVRPVIDPILDDRFVVVEIRR